MWKLQLNSSLPLSFNISSRRSPCLIQRIKDVKRHNCFVSMTNQNSFSSSAPSDWPNRKRPYHHITMASSHEGDDQNAVADISSQTDEPVAKSQWRPFHRRWQKQQEDETPVPQRTQSTTDGNAQKPTRRSRRLMKAQRKAEIGDKPVPGVFGQAYSWNGNIQQTSSMSTMSRPNEAVNEADTSKDDKGPRRKNEVLPPETPIPKPAYLEQASKPPVDLNFIQPLLIILDLNGTLIYRMNKKFPPKFVRRPALDHFLERLTARHVVMVWSSAREQTVEALCSKIFTPKQYQKLAAKWSRTQLGLTPAQYHSKVQVYKNLEAVWSDRRIQSKFPGKKDRAGKSLHHVLRYHPDTADKNEMTGAQNRRWDQSNTILIDDSRLKAASHPYNIVEVPEFTNLPDSNDDVVLKVLLTRIQMLAKTNDVSRRLRSWGEQGSTIRRDEIVDVIESETSSLSSSAGSLKKLKSKRTKRTSLYDMDLDTAAKEQVRRLAGRSLIKKSKESLRPVKNPAPLVKSPENGEIESPPPSPGLSIEDLDLGAPPKPISEKSIGIEDLDLEAPPKPISEKIIGIEQSEPEAPAEPVPNENGLNLEDLDLGQEINEGELTVHQKKQRHKAAKRKRKHMKKMQQNSAPL